MPSIPVVFGLIAFAGVFLLFLGISQMRRSAGGAEDFQARLAAYGVTTTAGAAVQPSGGLRDTMNRLFQPAADRMGRGDVKKGKLSVAEQLQRADLKLRPSEYFMIQIGAAVLVGLIVFLRFHSIFGWLAAFLGYLLPTNLWVCIQLRRPDPDLAKISRTMRNCFFAVGAQGTMQVLTIVIMARFVTGL